MNEQIKHLEMIQGIINKMNSNSFQLKGWYITIVSALLALFASNTNAMYLFVAMVPTIVFWILDAYYLQQERKFRGVYDDVVDCKIELFKMPIQNYTEGKYCYWNVIRSTTIWPLYGITFLCLLIGGIIFTLYN